MCIIVDANAIHRFFNEDAAAAVLLDAVMKPTTRITVGGTALKAEYEASKRFVSLMLRLEQAGRINFTCSADVDQECRSVEKLPRQSNDIHILALARVSKTRVLFSFDNALAADFKCSAILHPKGRVFKSPQQTQLLRCKRCKQSPRGTRK
jgi:predicted nucleic acid-binding protein